MKKKAAFSRWRKQEKQLLLRAQTYAVFAETAMDECGDKISAWETVEKIDKMASNALEILSTLDSGSNTELKLNLKDIEAQANLGLYNAYKFRAVMYVEQNKKEEARDAIGTGLLLLEKVYQYYG